VGYLLKDRVTDIAEFDGTVRRLASGAPHSTRRWCVSWSAVGARPPFWDRLTPRECKVLELIAEGRSNSALAQHLSIAERAVEKARLGHLQQARPAAAAGAPPSCARWPTSIP